MRKNKLLLILFFSLAAIYLALKIITMPPVLKTARLIEIPEGSNAMEIARLLENKKIIRNAGWFLYWTNRYRAQEKLKAGIYEFSGRTPLKRVISKLIKGEITLVRVSIPEGCTINDIAVILEKKDLAQKDDFINYASEKQLEGFLFPDTYFFPHKVSVEAISSTMFKRFKDIFNDINGEPVNDSNFKKVKEIVTVASILEKEAMHKNEREIIAGIIYKRIRKNIPIQSCATVIYSMDKTKARLSHMDLKIKSPYNTYMHRGLPPGPISNPGKVSIEAAINPKKTDYMFFVSMGDGRNYFSKTYAEHKNAVNLFLNSRTSTETSMPEENINSNTDKSIF
ncbi:MAG TPA: endolytic transglycosylase MltG [bacterium]|nr:endolytic transglycosylase MltG [bacterium]